MFCVALELGALAHVAEPSFEIGIYLQYLQISVLIGDIDISTDMFVQLAGVWSSKVDRFICANNSCHLPGHSVLHNIQTCCRTVIVNAGVSYTVTMSHQRAAKQNFDNITV